MDPILAFMVAIILVSLLTVKIGLSPFLSLLVSALVYGLVVGMGPELIVADLLGPPRPEAGDLSIGPRAGYLVSPPLSHRCGSRCPLQSQRPLLLAGEGDDRF